MIWLIFFVAIILHSFWLHTLAPKGRVETNFTIRTMTNEEFVSLAYLTAAEFNWRVLDINEDRIVFLTGKSLGSYGECVILKRTNGNEVNFYAEYLTQKVGWGQLNRLYPKYKQKFDETAKLFANDELSDFMINIKEGHPEFFEEREVEGWQEV